MFEIIFGLIGGCLGILLFIPQIFKTWKLKNSKGLSSMTWILILINVSCWSFYGVLIDNPIIFFPNIIATSLSLVMICMIRGFKSV